MAEGVPSPHALAAPAFLWFPPASFTLPQSLKPPPPETNLPSSHHTVLNAGPRLSRPLFDRPQGLWHDVEAAKQKHFAENGSRQDLSLGKLCLFLKSVVPSPGSGLNQ